MRTFIHQPLPARMVQASAGPLLAPDPSTLWRFVFGNTQPVFVEVGPGRGEFLIDSARRDPQHNYLGIERSRGRTRDIERRLDKHAELRNVRVVNGDAACVLALLADASVAGYFVLFPDPWWKVRHHRRRVVTPEFVATLRRTVARSGTIELATDVEGYFVVAQECLNADPGLEMVSAGLATAPSTSFSRKAQRVGTPIYRSRHRRR